VAGDGVADDFESVIFRLRVVMRVMATLLFEGRTTVG
jgi:hypothetical protein